MYHKLARVALALVLAFTPGAGFVTGEQLRAHEVCAVGARPLGERKPDSSTPQSVMTCFASATAAEAFIAAGAPGDLEQLFESAHSLRADERATVIIGRVWTGTARTGDVLIHYGVGSGCYGVTYGFPTLPSGWNDNIRSAEGFSNCWVDLYVDTWYGGASITCTPYASTLGSFSATTSSVVYRR